jgi:hypothetical protein
MKITSATELAVFVPEFCFRKYNYLVFIGNYGDARK